LRQLCHVVLPRSFRVVRNPYFPTGVRRQTRWVRPRTDLASGTVRVMFFTYLVLIVSGVAYFAVIGLTHH